MGRVRKSVPLDLIARYYGINVETGRVECVSRTDDGVLSMWRDEIQILHELGRGGSPEVACITRFGLGDVRYIPRAVLDDPIEQHILDGLEVKALAYRTVRARDADAKGLRGM